MMDRQGCDVVPWWGLFQVTVDIVLIVHSATVTAIEMSIGNSI